MEAVIQGTFADMKTVKTRKTLQIIIECPIELGEQVVKAFGFPDPSKEVNVAIARLNDKNVKEVVKPKSHAGEGKLLAQNPEFESFVMHQKGQNTIYPGEAEQWMKHVIGITSCAELIEGSGCYDDFKEYKEEFKDWQRQKQAQQQSEYYGYE